MAQATREISLAYGGTTIGGASTKYHLTGAYRLEIDNAQGALEVDVLVTAESVSDFTAFEQIWRDVRVTTTFTYLGSTLVSWNHSSGSGGVNTRASCSIPGTEEADAGLSRLYRVRIEADLIPNQTGQSGIRDHMAVITTPEYGAQRSAVISGVYIGSDLTTAVDAFCETVRTRNSISAWHLVNQDNEEDRDAKLVRWTRSYTEHFSGLRDHAAAVVVPESEQADVTVAGKYRGASYTSDVDSFAAAVKSRHSIGAWTLVSEQKDEDRQAQITVFSRKYAQTFLGIRDHDVGKFDDEREQKKLVISGVYTGASLVSDVDTYCATVLSRHSVTESAKVRDEAKEDRDANVIRWTREYIETFSGIRDHEVDVTTMENDQRKIVISGVYNGADLETDVDTYCATVLSRHSVTASELRQHSQREDRDANATRFSREYMELIYDQSSGARDSAEIRNAILIIGRSHSADEVYFSDPAAGPAVKPVEIALKYSCAIRHTLVTDLRAFYASTIKPFLIAQMTATLEGGSGLFLVREAPTFDFDSSRISVEMLAKSPAASGLLAATYRRRVSIQTGVRIAAVRGKSAYAGTRQQGTAAYFVTENWTRTRLFSANSLKSKLSGTATTQQLGAGTGFGQPTVTNAQAGSGGTATSGTGLGATLGGTALGSAINQALGSLQAGQGSGPQGSSPTIDPVDIGQQPKAGELIDIDFDEMPGKMGLPGYELPVIIETLMAKTQWYDPVDISSPFTASGATP